jgi:NADH-quinone oxidoreductase subunit M
VGEILTMTGTYNASTWAAIIAATGVILSAVYALTLYRRVVFGEMTNPALATIGDLEVREAFIFLPLIAATLILGVHPDAVFHITGASAQALVDAYQAATGQ